MDIFALNNECAIFGDTMMSRFLKEAVIPAAACRFYDFTLSGATITELTSMANDNNHNYHTIFAMAGTNDIKNGSDFEQLKSDADLLISALKRNASRVILLTPPPIPCMVMGDNMKRQKSFNTWLKSLKEDSVTIIDTWKVFYKRNHLQRKLYEKYYKGVRNPDGTTMRDGIHWNVKGMTSVKVHIDQVIN